MMTDIVSTVGMLLSFLIILCLSWLVSRYLGKHMTYRKKDGRIQVLEQAKIGNDQYVTLLKVDKTQYLLGSGQGKISVLDRIEGEDAS